MKYIIDRSFFIFLNGIIFCALVLMGLQTYTDNIFEQKKAEALKLMQEAEQEQKRMIANAVKAIKLDQLKCMALNIYYEARGEPFLGQVAVARVVMNRVADPAFPNDPCKVIYQKRNFINSNTGETKTVCQFSWVCENLTLPDKTNYHYQQAVKIAREVLKYDRWGDLLSDTTLFFHSIHVNPKWPHEPVERIGNHIFYEKNKD